MGYTPALLGFTESAIQQSGLPYRGLRMAELGDQLIMHCHDLPPNYPAKRYFANRGILHRSFDLNGEAGAEVVDLGKPVTGDLVGVFDIVTDIGTLEHVENQYQAWKNVHDMCRVGGLMVHCLAPPGHWLFGATEEKAHGRFYYLEEFPHDLATVCGYGKIRAAVMPHIPMTGRNMLCFAVQKTFDGPFMSSERWRHMPVLDVGDNANVGNYDAHPKGGGHGPA